MAHMTSQQCCACQGRKVSQKYADNCRHDFKMLGTETGVQSHQQSLSRRLFSRLIYNGSIYGMQAQADSSQGWQTAKMLSTEGCNCACSLCLAWWRLQLWGCCGQPAMDVLTCKDVNRLVRTHPVRGGVKYNTEINTVGLEGSIYSRDIQNKHRMISMLCCPSCVDEAGQHSTRWQLCYVSRGLVL